jgi:hypothetical protein
MNPILETGKDKGFEIVHGIDYGAGPIDVVWSINVHPALPDIRCGFIALRSEEEHQSGMDKTYLIAENEEMARSAATLLTTATGLTNILQDCTIQKES